MPIVVVGNKTDLPREISKESVEARVRYDWEHGYVECCAKDDLNITAIFKELLVQAKSRSVCRVVITPPHSLTVIASGLTSVTRPLVVEDFCQGLPSS